MKNIKLLLLLLCGTVMAQSHSESIADPLVAAHKTAISGLLGSELSLRKKQGDLVKDLEDTEEDYNSKRSVFANFQANTLVVGAVQTKLASLSKRIGAIKDNINILKIASFGFGHGLSRYQNQLETEERYLQKLQKENTLLGGGVFIGGGTGQVYSAYLKLLIRLIKIKNNILKIDKEIKAKMKITKILAK